MNKRFILRRNGPDVLTEELINAVSGAGDIEFKPLFNLVYASLRVRNAAHGGEEILRLRIYERLQWLVQAGGVDKTGKIYRGNSKRLQPFTDQLATRHCHELLDAVRSAASKQSSLESRGDGFGEDPIFPQRR